MKPTLRIELWTAEGNSQLLNVAKRAERPESTDSAERAGSPESTETIEQWAAATKGDYPKSVARWRARAQAKNR
jgi:hypothetical protein